MFDVQRVYSASLWDDWPPEVSCYRYRSLMFSLCVVHMAIQEHYSASRSSVHMLLLKASQPKTLEIHTDSALELCSMISMQP